MATTKNTGVATGNEPLNYQNDWSPAGDANVFAPVTSGQASSNPLPPGVKGGSKTVLSDIESQADYYSPETYRKFLTFYTSSQFDTDSNQDFIAVSQTKANPKLFVVGIIPPAYAVTGNILDRSATVGAVTGASAQELDFGDSGGVTLIGLNGDQGIVTAPGYAIAQGTGGLKKEAELPKSSIGENGGEPNYTQLSIPQLWTAIGGAYRNQFGRDPTPTELQFYVAQSLRETGGKLPNNNFGYIGNYPTQPKEKQTFAVKTQKGGTAYFNSYPGISEGAAAFVGQLSRNPNTVKSAKAGDSLAYMTSLAQQGYYQEPVDTYYNGNRGAKSKSGMFPDLLTSVARSMRPHGVALGDGGRLPAHAPNSCAFNESVFQYRERVAPNRVGLTKTNQFRFLADSPYGANCPLGINATPASDQPETNGNWTKDGSPNAAKAKAAEAKVAGTDLNTTELGKRYIAAQKAEIQQTQLLVENMSKTPPLRLLVNPTSFKISSEKIISDSNWTRNGPVVEHWGEQQDKIDASGKLAAFFAIDAASQTPGCDGSSPGLTRVARNYTASYQNFLSLYLLYKNNGYLFTSGLDEKNSHGQFSARLSLVGSMYIYYDNALYIGSFDNFSITETDDKPYTLEYNFQFTVRATFLLDRPDEYSAELKKMYSKNPSLSTTFSTNTTG